MAALLVRHAKAGSRDKWRGPGPDEIRPLNKKGWRQARRLADDLRPFDVRRILSSPYVRCVQTLLPMAEPLGLEVEPVDELAESANPRRALTLIRQAIDELSPASIAMCSHGDVIPQVLDLLVAEEGLDLPPYYPCEKGSTWVVEREGDRWAARYLPPPPA